MFGVVFGTEEKNSTFLFLPGMSYRAVKGLTALAPEIDCDQKAMSLPPVTSAVFLLSQFSKMWVSRRNV
jgi:hypothetical protein